jgi:LysR family glycine cleavage system transcriptional activator
VRLDENTLHAICSRALADELGPAPDLAALSKQTFLVHTDMPLSFEAWKAALGLEALQPAAIDHYDSGQLILEAAAQGLGIAIMHDDHLKRNKDPRLARLFDVEIRSPYSYYFVCRPVELETRPVRLFHDWLVNAGL